MPLADIDAKAASPALSGPRHGVADAMVASAVVIGVPTLFWLGVLEITAQVWNLEVQGWMRLAVIALNAGVILPIWAGLALRERR